MLFLHYPPCSTCKKAKNWLDENGVHYTARHIKEDQPTYEELKSWLHCSGLPIKKFFNTSGLQYRALELKDKLPTMSEEEQLRLLATDGMLVKRPILITDDNHAIIGFKEIEWAALLLKAGSNRGIDTMQKTAVVGKKSNKAFMILSALGILFVLDSHVGPNFSLKFVIFEYGSFYMPMFAFISGYFFSEKHIQSWGSILQFTDRKIRTLLVPYFFWIVFYGIVTAIFRYFDLLEIGSVSMIDLIHNIITGGTSFYFNDPAWFVPLLFCVIISYTLIRKLMGKHWNHYIAMIVFALMGAEAVALSQTDFRTHNTFMLMKIPCFLQYYHLGVLFREKLEKWYDKLNPILVCSLAATVNLVLISIYGTNLSFPLYATMDGFELNAPFIPLITSITGIAFWLRISKSLVPVLGQNKLINFISDNTFFFMTHHLAVKHIFLAILIAVHNAGIWDFSGIDQQQFRMYAWYSYSDSFLWSFMCLLFTIAILIPLCAAFLNLQTRFLTCCKKNKSAKKP